MAISTLIMCTSALCVKLINGRVPLFEVVVRTPSALRLRQACVVQHMLCLPALLHAVRMTCSASTLLECVRARQTVLLMGRLSETHYSFRQLRDEASCGTLTPACAARSLFRSLFSAAMCWALARAQRVPHMFGPMRLWPAYAFRGIPGAASMVFYYQAIAMLPLSDAVRPNPARTLPQARKGQSHKRPSWLFSPCARKA